MKPTIIIVDDEADITEIVGKLATSTGFEVREANSGQELIKHYAESEPDAIILDLVMPDMDGIEVLHWLKDENSKVPIILISGFGDITSHGDNYMSAAETIGSAFGLNIVGTLFKQHGFGELVPMMQGIINSVEDTE